MEPCYDSMGTQACCRPAVLHILQQTVAELGRWRSQPRAARAPVLHEFAYGFECIVAQEVEQLRSGLVRGPPQEQHAARRERQRVVAGRRRSGRSARPRPRAPLPQPKRAPLRTASNVCSDGLASG